MTPALALVLLGALWLAWSNGANDNFKGVATLYGSGVLGYRQALCLATLATLAGGLLSVWLAQGLAQTFSGNGLIAGGMNDAMLAAAGIGAGATVLLATRLGMPTSTTHALTGALLGAALASNSGGVNWAVLIDKFAQPLLLSPLLAIALTLLFYPALHRLRRGLGMRATRCVCVGNDPLPVPAGATVATSAAMPAPGLTLDVVLGDTPGCAARFGGQAGGRFVGVDVGSAVNALHVLSAASVCFARAVNDTPKIAALLLAAAAVSGQTPPTWIVMLIALVMVSGGLIQGRRVAETLSRGITSLDHGQGLTANLVTAGLVLGASNLGLPVSTTHVATGAIFGIGAVNGQRNWRTIVRILLTWIVTLPLGLALGAGMVGMFRALGT
jgi:PiT family inorganic phosphate transporter